LSYRVYYNKHSEAPYIWSIDGGTQDTEVKVKDIQFHKVEAETGGDFAVPIGDQERPRVFFTVHYATLVIKDGVGHFFHNPDWRKPRIADTIRIPNE
jgi:hypothetical protein